MSMQLFDDIANLAWAQPSICSSPGLATATYGSITNSISTTSYDEISDRVYRIEKILVDMMKDYPELIIKYPDLVKEIRR